MLTKSYSQAGQDLFLNRILGDKRDGSFLEIGANHPIELSNTFAVESQLGWRGIMVERDDYCADLIRKHRTSFLFHVDALTADWPSTIDAGLLAERATTPFVIDYLSLDCDENTSAILATLLPSISPSRFRVMTIETDLYRLGEHVAHRIDTTIENHDYDIICKNVRASDGSIFESWAVDPKLVDMGVAERYRSDGLRWEEILKL